MAYFEGLDSHFSLLLLRLISTISNFNTEFIIFIICYLGIVLLIRRCTAQNEREQTFTSLIAIRQVYMSFINCVVRIVFSLQLLHAVYH